MIDKTKRLLLLTGLIILLSSLVTVFSIYHAQHRGGFYLRYPLFLYSTAVISIALGAVIVLFFKERLEKHKIENILEVLPSNEKKIMKVLIDREEIEQKKLVTLSELSRVKVSRVLSRLEEREVISKRTHGHTNLITLEI